MLVVPRLSGAEGLEENLCQSGSTAALIPAVDISEHTHQRCPGCCSLQVSALSINTTGKSINFTALIDVLL